MSRVANLECDLEDAQRERDEAVEQLAEIRAYLGAEDTPGRVADILADILADIRDLANDATVKAVRTGRKLNDICDRAHV